MTVRTGVTLLPSSPPVPWSSDSKPLLAGGTEERSGRRFAEAYKALGAIGKWGGEGGRAFS